jgi:hypothetical protein
VHHQIQQVIFNLVKNAIEAMRLQLAAIASSSYGYAYPAYGYLAYGYPAYGG